MSYIIWIVVNLFCTASIVGLLSEKRVMDTKLFGFTVLNMLSWLAFMLEFQNEVC